MQIDDRSLLKEGGESSCPRILLVSVFFPPDQGGVEAAAGEFARTLPKLGFRVTVATTTPQPIPDGKLDVHVFPHPGFSTNAAALARNIHADLVLVNGLLLNGDLSLPFDVVAAGRIPVIYRAHGFHTTFRFYWRKPPFFGLGTFLRSFIRAVRNAIVFRGLAQTVFLDNSIGVFNNFDILLARLFHSSNTSFIPNSFSSIQHDQMSGFRLKYGLAADKTFFLCVANYSDGKGQKDVVRILRRNPDIDAVFVFVGARNNDSFKAAAQLVENDPRIRLLVDIPRGDVIDALNACDAAFLYSRKEQQPLFLSEAMSCGKPWICTNVGSVSKMRGGIVLRRRDSRQFIRAVRELMNSERRNLLGSEGREFWTTNYAPEVVYARWKRMFDDIVRGRVKCGY